MKEDFSWKNIKDTIQEAWNNLPEEQKTYIKDQFKRKFGKVPESELNKTGADREKLIELIQKNYGWDRERAEEELEKWENDIASKQRR